MHKFRQEINYNFKEWDGIVGGEPLRQFSADGLIVENSLVRTPKGFFDESTALEYLKLKGYYTKRDCSDTQLKAKDLVPHLL